MGEVSAREGRFLLPPGWVGTHLLMVGKRLPTL